MPTEYIGLYIAAGQMDQIFALFDTKLSASEHKTDGFAWLFVCVSLNLVTCVFLFI